MHLEITCPFATFKRQVISCPFIYEIPQNISGRHLDYTCVAFPSLAVGDGLPGCSEEVVDDPKA